MTSNFIISNAEFILRTSQWCEDFKLVVSDARWAWETIQDSMPKATRSLRARPGYEAHITAYENELMELACQLEQLVFSLGCDIQG